MVFGKKFGRRIVGSTSSSTKNDTSVDDSRVEVHQKRSETDVVGGGVNDVDKYTSKYVKSDEVIK